MKKLVSLACALLVLCSLSACSGAKKLTVEDFALYQQGGKILEHDGKENDYKVIFSFMEDYYGTPGIYETKRGVSIGDSVDLVFEQYKGLIGEYHDDEGSGTITFLKKETIQEVLSSPLNGKIVYFLHLIDGKPEYSLSRIRELAELPKEQQPEKLIYYVTFVIQEDKVNNIWIYAI